MGEVSGGVRTIFIRFVRRGRFQGGRLQAGLLASIAQVTVFIATLIAFGGDRPALALDVTDPFQAATAKPLFGDYDKMVTRRQIRVLIPLSKTYFFLDGGEARGIAVEALRAFEKDLNAKIKDKSKRIFFFAIPTPRGRLLEDLAAGKGDLVIANLTITPERQEKVAFSDPVLTGVKELVVTPASAKDIQSLDDLSGLTITVRSTSSYFASLKKVNETLEAKGYAPIKIVEADYRLEDEDILDMVQSGLTEATVVDNHIYNLWSQVYENLKAHEAASLRTDGNIAWAFRKDSPQFAAVVNKFVAQSKKGTERGNIVFSEYFKSDKLLKKASDPANTERLNGLLFLFRKYGEMYGIDPFLMAAVAFQESRFDQKLVMRTGATGIMQMMPATARDPNVNLPNITNLEENVHAFAKYFKFLRDRYVNQDGMEEFDRRMLLLASYNAGPERLKKLRAKSTDPNVWYENVEWAVWKSVGLETVQYVRNVHRYYIAFIQAYTSALERRNLKHAAE